MPFTPFHGALGLAAKAASPRRFSFTVFAATQVAIDLESGFNLFLERDPVLGLLAIGIVSVVWIRVVSRVPPPR